MAWTYAAMSVPAELTKDLVRFYVGDTVAEDPQIQDEEIAGMILAYPTRPRVAAAAICEALAAKFSRLVDVKVGSKTVSMSQLAERYAARATWLRTLEDEEVGGSTAGIVIVGPYVAGLSVAERDLDRDDPDLIQPPFGLVGDGDTPSLVALTDTITQTQGDE